MKQPAIILHREDSVATTVTALARGEAITLGHGGDRVTVTLGNDIPFGHKFALRDIRKGEVVIKYGEPIGVASEDIPQGAHVHVHNVESARGRGDR
jgi:altronate dehydratase small subunit